MLQQNFYNYYIFYLHNSPYFAEKLWYILLDKTYTYNLFKLNASEVRSEKGGLRMQEIRYMISDTAKKVEVEAHVLRYWEEELSLNIARNEMGHRYYTPKDVQVFLNIKKLKEQGFQLKTIKMVLPELENENVDNIIKRKEELNMEAENAFYGRCQTPAPYQNYSVNVANATEYQNPPVGNGTDMNEKMQQFQIILGNIVAQALHNNNENLSQDIGERVSERVVKELNCVEKEREEREEERFKKLDESIRNIQQAKEKPEKESKKRRKKGLFAKKQKPVKEESLA